MSESKYHKVAEELKSLSAKMQVINNYDENLDSWSFETSLKQTNEEAKKTYHVAEELLGDKDVEEDDSEIADDFYVGTIVVENEESDEEWVMMDSDTLRDEYNEVLDEHRKNKEEAEVRDPKDVLQDAVDDYKYLVHSVVRYNLREDVESPSKERDGSEIL